MPRLNLSRIVILCLGGFLALQTLHLLAGAPPTILGAGLLVDAIITGALFRIDWDHYWATLPSRIGNAFWLIKKYIWFCLAGEAVGMVLLWQADHMPRGDDAFLIGLIGMMTVGVISFAAVAVLVIPVIVALIANPEGMPDGRRMVEGQDIHGSAGFANASAVDAALKGANPPSPVRASARPSIGYRYED